MKQTFVTVSDLFELDYFSIIDIAFSVLMIILIMFIVNLRKKRYRELDYSEYYTTNVYMKIALAIVYAMYYLIIVNGGDTMAYWDGALKMNNLFWKSPMMYFEELFSEPTQTIYFKHFDIETGYPPGWIYREKESWFVSKIMSIIVFVSFKSYLVATIVMAYISSLASWKLYELIHGFKLHTNRNIAIAAILIPSVSFWCSGITKDTIVLFSTIFIVFHSFQILSLDKKTTWKNWFFVIFYTIILNNLRSFMLATIFLPMIFSYSVRLIKKYKGNNFAIVGIRFLSLVLGILFFVYQGGEITNSEQLEQAAAINRDFATNLTYDGARYDIGITDYSAQGMIKVFPAAVLAGFYRPFPWEALSLTMIANGIEDTYYLYLTFLFVRRGFIGKIKAIRKHEFLVFAFFFMLLMAYMAGVTSGLLGVLVRFKAPLIPFLIIILTIKSEKEKKTELEEIIAN